MVGVSLVLVGKGSARIVVRMPVLVALAEVLYAERLLAVVW